VLREVGESLAKLCAPFFPHLAEELWVQMGNASSIFQHAWPVFDPSIAAEETLTIVVQVNGKVRSRLDVPAGTPDSALREQALNDERVKALAEGRPPKKVVVVPGKLVNVVY
jgi:leucyl-tRNA synthetase